MLYKVLLTIGSFIILLFLMTTYFLSLKKTNKITYRQRMYMILASCGFVSILMDILEVIFFATNIKILYIICWYSHWISTIAFYYMIYYYFRIFFEIDTVNSIGDLFIDREKKLSIKNASALLSFLSYVLTIVFVKPLQLGEPFVFIPKYTIPFILVLMIFFVVILGELIYTGLKNKKVKKQGLIIMAVIISSIFISTVIQMIVADFAFLGIGIYLTVMLIYYLIENIDLIITDELKVLQKNIEKSSNAKLDFLYNMSHDIRSPMNAIVELSKSLRDIDEFNEESIRADIKSIKFSCNNLVEIVNNILDINKIASGNESVQTKEYNLNKLLADLPYVIETRIGSKPIKLEFDIDQNIASKLEGDTTKIYRVIMNILTNSVKYTEVGKIRMIIKGDVAGNIQNLHIKISDTGYGIKKEDYDKMFTKFNRLDDATDNAIEGTGLGLVITKKYVDSMGGKIWFESEYGAGTIFYIDLPQKILDTTPLSQAVDTQENKKIELCDCTKSRVLIVDDNALNIKITKKILEKYNIEVDTVKTGKDCIFKIKSGQSYDLILLDDVLPDLGGMEVVHVVKNIQGFDIPPVIAYTANVMNGIKEEYLAKGFDDYMPKPLDIYQFDGIIKRYCYKQKNGE